MADVDHTRDQAAGRVLNPDSTAERRQAARERLDAADAYWTDQRLDDAHQELHRRLNAA
jgi:hypothetical protein